VKVWQQSEELLELPIEELQAIVGADGLNVKEEMVWEYVLQWIDHDTDNRKGHIVDLLKNIRLGLLDRNFLTEKVSIPLKMCVLRETLQCKLGSMCLLM
jgi:kelch-like protein 10